MNSLSLYKDIMVATGRLLCTLPAFMAKNLQYEKEVYLSPGVVWFPGGEPLELQVVDGGDRTIDRDGSVRRAQLNLTIAILLRRPISFEGQHASILTGISDDIQTYSRDIRDGLEGVFLSYTDTIGVDPIDLLVRPLVYMGSTHVQSNAGYPDLLIKEMAFTGGVNDSLLD